MESSTRLRSRRPKRDEELDLIDRSPWDTLKLIIKKIDADVCRNAGGNIAAGIRVRRALRKVKKIANELIVSTNEIDKKKKSLRRRMRDNRNTVYNKT